MTAKKNNTPGAEDAASTAPTPGAEDAASTAPTPGAEDAASTAPTPGAEDAASTAPTLGAEEAASTAPTLGAEEVVLSAAELDRLEKLIGMVRDLNHYGHRQGLLSDLIDRHGAEVVVVGPDEDNAFIRLAGIEGGYSTSLEIRLENWLQIARQKFAVAMDAAAHQAKVEA